ncbi:TIGR00296 family protein [Hippea maritima]|uniref:AMMECR1-domain protein n=1 Tax=Hippea maritima (strain ATCC 700847 / DSM 10411 / MH2) TaxID=760142 RepID=F2LY14_HIPMA|nr:TIGR00296 family protein [Hippea maritima]AEA33279.1 AMMECR1-domain protein [Hippea maritima DSM 10411]
MNLSLKEGEFLVRLAREAIEYFFKNKEIMPLPEEYPEIFNQKRGVFVTLNSYPNQQLRGCIGYPLAYEPLIKGVISSALSAAFADPRFEPLNTVELDKVTVEVTVLSPMIQLDASRPYTEQIKVGRDGLYVVCGASSGLLLPQVPVEWGWDEEAFLANVCHKAGLPYTCYKDSSCTFYRFTGQIFEEETPNGRVIEKKIEEVL